MKRRFLALYLAPLVMLILAVGLRRAEPLELEEAQLAFFDVLQRAYPRPYQEAPVRIVDLDDASLSRLGQFPWPRTRVAELVRRLTEMGAAVIAFDVVFAEPDRTSPQQVFPLWPDVPLLEPVREQMASLPDHDQVLAQAMSESRVVTGFVLMEHAGGGDPAVKAGFSWRGAAGEDLLGYLPDLLGGVANLSALEEAAAGNGSFSIPWPETDGIYRRVPLLFRRDQQLYPSLALEALRVATGGTTYIVETSRASGRFNFGEGTGIHAVRVSRQLTIPTDSRGRVWIHFSEPAPHRYVPAWQVLDGSANRSLLEGHVVFIGTSAEGLKDLRATPVDSAMAGVEIHAQLVEQVLVGHYLVRPDWTFGAEVVAMLLLGSVLMVALPRLGAAWCALLGGASLVLVLGFSWWAFTERMWLVGPVYTCLAVLLIYLAGSLSSFLRTEGERREIRTAFGRYLAPEVVAHLARHPEQLRLGGETREMTMLFSDVRGFTALAEQLEPQDLTSLMNSLLTPMTSIIHQHQGTIDKYMGDCVMAFWNAPLDDPQHAHHACHAALAMERGLSSVNETLRREAEATGRDHQPLRVGIGVNTGFCCVGNMGSDQRFDYSVVGDEVNLASRLEGQSPRYGVTAVMGENTQAAVPDLATLELDRVRVKGRLTPVRIFALLGDAERAREPGHQALVAAQDKMLEAYRSRNWEGAQEALAHCRELGPSLGVLWDLYSERLAEFQAQPPGSEWDGVYIASSK